MFHRRQPQNKIHRVVQRMARGACPDTVEFVCGLWEGLVDTEYWILTFNIHHCALTSWVVVNIAY